MICLAKFKMKLRKLDKKGTRVLTLRLVRSNLLKSKHSAEKYYLIVSIILGLILLIIALFWIFQEYFSEDELSRETCRQSIILRGTMPESERILTTDIDKLKSNFPLKCKTEVVEIKNDESIQGYSELADNVMKQIANKMVECWSLVGEGNYHLFPMKYVAERKDCMACSRIRFSDDLKKRITLLPLGEYLLSHNLDGKEIPREQWHSDGEKVRIVPGTYAHYFSSNSGNFRLFDSFKLPGLEEWKKEEQGTRAFGVRNKINMTKGDLIIGTYFYSNNEIFENWIRLKSIRPKKYEYSYVFYTQIGVDDISECNFDGIPA